ncbi:MAG: hypothetical protein MHM6MM_008477 [Cercozoa sp. M6MM]
MRDGDLPECLEMLRTLSLWQQLADRYLVASGELEKELLMRVRESALATYLYAYGAQYKSLGTALLCEMFELSELDPFDPDGSDTTLKWYHPTCFFVAQLRVRKGTRKLSSTEEFEGDTSGIDSEDIRLVQRLIDGETLWTTTDVDEFRSMKDTPDKLGVQADQKQ